jgi:hypothetical protein
MHPDDSQYTTTTPQPVVVAPTQVSQGHHLSVLTFRSPSVVSGRSPRLKFAANRSVHSASTIQGRCSIPSASSHARPAPNPVPNQTGHARLLKRSTEKITPNEKPRPDRITREESARSHCKFCVSWVVLRGSMRGIPSMMIRSRNSKETERNGWVYLEGQEGAECRLCVFLPSHLIKLH